MIRQLRRRIDAALDCLTVLAIYLAPVMFPRSLDGLPERAEQRRRDENDE